VTARQFWLKNAVMKNEVLWHRPKWEVVDDDVTHVIGYFVMD
jgi:hypothetical protein